MAKKNIAKYPYLETWNTRYGVQERVVRQGPQPVLLASLQRPPGRVRLRHRPAGPG